MDDFRYQTEPLDEHEDVLGVFYGNRGQWGAQFVVSNRRLLFGPLDEEILSFGLDKAGVPGVDFVRSILERYGPRSPKTLWLRHVTQVAPTHDAGLFKAPGLRINTATGEVFNLQIVHSPRAMSRDPKNNLARDRAVATIQAAAEAAKAVPGPGV
jgi:hypothetical protein